jgi:hypothetical protein
MVVMELVNEAKNAPAVVHVVMKSVAVVSFNVATIISSRTLLFVSYDDAHSAFSRCHTTLNMSVESVPMPLRKKLTSEFHIRIRDKS